MTSVIEFQSVSKRYTLDVERARSLQEIFIQRRARQTGQIFWALQDVSFTVKAGERVGLIGSNGSGKSTILKLISRVIEPTKGSIKTIGRIAGLLELGTGFHPDLTGRENIFLNASILGISRRDVSRQIEAIIDFADIGPFIDVQVRNYSSGMIVRLGFAVTTILEPEILLIDEVLAVGDQSFQNKCMMRLEELQQQGVTLFFVSHNIASVQRLCRRAIWLAHGQVQADGDPIEVGGAYMDVQFSTGLRLNPQFGKADHTRWGTFQIEITQVEFLKQDGSSPEFFRSGDFFQLRMHYVAHEPIYRPTFGFSIFRSDGVQVNSPNSAHDGLQLESVDGEGYVDFLVEQLPLNEGDYELTVAIYTQDLSSAYDHQHRRYPLRVRAAGVLAETGVVHIAGRWLIHPSSSSD